MDILTKLAYNQLVNSYFNKMQINPLLLERYFAKYEFSAKYLLCSSDCDGLPMQKLVEMATPDMKYIWSHLKLGYTESLGHPLLRKEISKLYSKIDADHVITLAPQEGIFTAMNVLLSKGDHVICTFPTYQSLYEVARSIGCELTEWRSNEADGWRFDPEDLIKLIKKNTKLLVINFPHNPTGYLPSKEDFNRIIQIARESNLYIFSDEMYRLLEFDEKDRLPSVSDVYDKAISLFGLSKSFGLAGLRTGWLTTQSDDIFTKLAAFKDYITICSSAPSEILAIIALQNKDMLIQANIAKIRKNIESLDSFFHRNKKLFSWVKPKASTICFPKLEFDMKAYDFCEKVVKESGIMLMPSEVYEFATKHIRIGFGRENFPHVIQKFESYLNTELKIGGENK